MSDNQVSDNQVSDNQAAGAPEGDQAADTDPANQKFGADSGLSDGPVKNRGCTDILCLILFIVHIGAFWVLSLMYAGQDAANPAHLYMPRDFKGGYCGADGLASHEFMIFTLNVTKAVDDAAELALCSPGWDAYKDIPGFSEADYVSACSSTSEGLNLSDMLSNAQGSLQKYTTVEGVQELLTGGGGGSSILSAVTVYFNQACVSKCGVDFTSSGNDTSVAGARTYVYEPSADRKWAAAWNQVVAFNSDLASVFTFDALPVASCPYDDAKYCVPLPGVSFTDLAGGYCSFAIESGMFGDMMSDATASMIGAIGESSVANDLSGGLDEAFATTLETWDVTVIVAIVSFVVGLVFLILLRFFIKPVVWLAVLLVLVLFLVGGLVMYVYSTACKDTDLGAVDADLGATLAAAEDCLEYKVASEGGRQALQYCSYGAFGLAAVYVLVIICVFNRIRLAVNLNAVAAQFVYQTPHIVLVPVIQAAISIVWCIIWVAMATFLLSQVPNNYVDTDAKYPDYNTASDNCVQDKWPVGGLYMNDATGEWMCYQPRYAIDYRFWFSLFSFFWHLCFIDAVGQCTIAGAVGVWFFNKGDRATTFKSLLSVCEGFKNCFRYHLGSLAFGSFILAVVKTVKWFMVYLEKQAKAQGNKIMEIICKIFAYCLWCFEKSVKFLNKNAYIQVALMGKNFCVSAKNAFFLILRNAVRFGVLGSLGFIVHFIGQYLIMLATAVLGFLILEAMHSDVASAPYICIFFYCVIGYAMGCLFMNVFGLAVDATLQCFIATEEMEVDPSFIPAKLRTFISDHEKDGDNEAGKHDTCGCCHGCCH